MFERRSWKGGRKEEKKVAGIVVNEWETLY